VPYPLRSFNTREKFDHQHYAFIASDEEFDAILSQVKEEGITFRSEHDSSDDNEINHNHQGRGFYFRDANGHSWEVITHTYI
jgi:catechol 2,3-dioxygenase-like lactoylglutathione lyase family enzyme